MRAILTYHSIDSSGSVISVDAKRWRAHSRWLESGAVRVLGLEELVRGDSMGDALALTFDDGFANFADEAWPPLRDRGLPVTVFVVSDHAGGTNAWAGKSAPGIPTLGLLDWDAIGRLAEEGVTIGAHTRTHPDLRTLDPSALADELEGAAERIAARTGRRPGAFAYPYGATDARVTAAAGHAYRVACTTEFRALRQGEDPSALPRLDAHYFRAPGRLESWGSGSFRRYLWLRGRARRVRSALAVLGGSA
ncbi:MAG: polysaccharide deacetylase family protein [Gemmatimonadetes bacterium]|nr:polysaccharide deacetylase family protein [Gemmatimonadota bacterium]